MTHSQGEENRNTQAPYGKGEPLPTRIEESAGPAANLDTTTFVDDGTMVTNDTSHFVRINDMYFKNSDNMVSEQSIIDFLKKPIVLTNGSFSTTDTFTFLNFYDLPYAALTSTQGLLWMQKLAGYFGIRMTMRARIVVNANKFQQGRYCMGWVPFCGGTYNAVKNLNHFNMHVNTLVQRTTIQHVELDLNNDTSAELVIPFSSVRNFYPINEALGATRQTVLGYLSVYPYSPLSCVSGSTTASYTIYISFEDVELIGAASAQSGLPDKELSNKFNGPLSSPLSAVSRGFKEFESIPLLSSYATSVSWIADRLARTAKIFGFSKPTQGDSMIKTIPLSGPNHSTVDGDSDARSVGLLSKPGVTQVVGLSGNDFDEMDFSFIARKFAWFNTTNWPTSATTGNLVSFDVTPANYLVSGSYAHFTPLMFVSKFFVSWRGSIKYRFKFVKTQFHSGRLSFTFYPTQGTISYTGGPQYVHRWIVDIRDTSEIEIVVPYIADTQYKDVFQKTGVLSVDIVDPLVAPGTVQTSISILVETAGGDDYEVAIPSAYNYSPSIVSPQSGVPKAYNIMTGTIGSSQVNADPNIASSVAIGEKVSNFRAFLKRFSRIRPNTGANTSTLLLNSPGVAMIPDFIPVIATTPGTDYWQPDITAVIAMCYGMWRGGIRVRDVLSKGMLTTTSLSPMNATYGSVEAAVDQTVPAVSSAAGLSFSSVAYGYSVVLQEPDKNGVITCEVPQYTNGYGRAISDCWADGTALNKYYGGSVGTSGGYLFFNAPIAGFGAGVTPRPGYTVHNLFRSLADDGSFSNFISVPPMINSGSNLINWGAGFY